MGTIKQHDGDLKTLQDLVLSLPMISSFILDNLGRIQFYPRSDNQEAHINKLQRLSKTIELLDQLGWIEHTGDWDPYLEITLTTGKIIETSSGYWHFSVQEKCPNGPYIEIENPTDEVLHYNVNLIKSIEILR
jgi:hypothetical protein